jgi:acyl carrier protein
MAMSHDSQPSRQAPPGRDLVLRDVREIVAEKMGMSPDKIRDVDALVEDLGCDSLDIVEISMELEEHFEISIPDDFGERISTIEDVADGVLQLLTGA